MTNIRNVNSAHWRAWMKPEFRCLVPATPFCEPIDAPDPSTGRKRWTWFALAEERPLFAFAGIWCNWHGLRGTQKNPVQGEHTLYGSPCMGFRFVAHSRFDRLFLPTLAGLIGSYLAIFVYYVGATIITVPVYDLLGWILHYDQYWRGGDWWHYLWLPHNEHRLIWLIAVYLPGIPTGHEAASLDWTALPKLGEYYIRLLGLPWSRVAPLVWFGRFIGCIVLGASIATLASHGILRRSIDRLERIGLALLMFSLLITAMAAVSRWSVAPERAMPIRYGIFTALAEAGLLLANAPLLERLWYRGHRWPFQWAMLAAAAVLLVQQVAGGQAAVAVTMQFKDAYREFVAGQWTAASVRYVFPDRPGAEKALGIIRRLHIYQN